MNFLTEGNGVAKKKQKQKKEAEDDLLEGEYYTEVEFVCPKRGKIKQRIKVKKYKTPKYTEEITYLKTKSTLLDDDDDLSIIDLSEDMEGEE